MPPSGSWKYSSFLDLLSDCTIPSYDRDLLKCLLQCIKQSRSCRRPNQLASIRMNNLPNKQQLLRLLCCCHDVFSVTIHGFSNRFKFEKQEKWTFSKAFEGCWFLTVSEAYGKWGNGMPKCRPAQLTANSNSLMRLVILEVVDRGPRISYLWTVISYMQLFYIMCLTC